MASYINFTNLSLAAEIGSSFGMLFLTSGALIYICRSKDRAFSWTNVSIFLTLIISFSFSATLSIYDLRNGITKNLTVDQKALSGFLYAFQFIFQWLSLLIFTIEYLSTEQEVRKVLDIKTSKRKREIYLSVGVIILLVAVLVTFFAC